jgi:hypothetical protein
MTSAQWLSENVLRIKTGVPNSVWQYSEFPHPLITLDFNSDDELIGASIVITKPEGSDVPKRFTDQSEVST